jgi:predicted ATPase/transcriptional regulator with XRE-family HTH domain
VLNNHAVHSLFTDRLLSIARQRGGDTMEARSIGNLGIRQRAMSTSSPGMLGTLLKRFRMSAALSQQELAERSTVSVRTISDIERGQRTTARFETVRQLARALDLSERDRGLLVEAAQPKSDQLPASQALALALAPPAPAPVPSLRVQTLPAQPTPMIGREAVLSEIVGAVENNPGRAITLTGPGGIGKTRLAIEAARRSAASFDDGVAFANLAPLADPASVAVTIAQALGITTGGVSLPESISQFLQDRSMMLVLDNFEHLIEAAPVISQLLAAAPGLSVLVTSRMRLRLSTELEIPIQAFDLPATDDPINVMHKNEAVRLFVDRACATDPEFELTAENTAAVAEVCHRLAGLPLAIELVAYRLRVLPLLSLLNRLDRQLPLLAGGSRDMPLRQQSMRSSIAWSYDLLNPAEQRMFRWMSVFAGGMSLEAAEATGDASRIDSPTTLDIVSGLVESGLIQRVRQPETQHRFRMLEPVREYGIELLAAMTELEEARMHHATYFLAFASDNAPLPDKPMSEDWLGRIAREYDNLVLAFDHLCQERTRGKALRFAVAMGPYWYYHGLVQEGWSRMQRTMSIASPEPSLLKGQALFWASGVALDAWDFEQAAEYAMEGLALARALGNRGAEAAAIGSLAWNEELQAHWDVASDLLEQALSIWRELENPFMQAQTLMLLGGQAYVQGNFELARAREEEAERLFELTGGTTWQASTQWYLGFIAVAEGRIADAAQHYDRSLRLWLSIDYRSHLFKPLVHLADIAARSGQSEHAARLLGAAGKLLRDTGARLFPFDVPAHEHAEQASKQALGEQRFLELRTEGQTSSPEDLLALSREIALATYIS